MGGSVAVPLHNRLPVRIMSIMIGRRVVIAAVLMYVAVIGCVMWPDGSAARSPGDSTRVYSSPTTMPVGLPYRGVAMQIQRVDWIDRYEKSMDQIADLGADTVLLVVDARQENGKSSHIYLDMRMTPTPEKLSELIDHAKKLKLRVILMPIVLLDAPDGKDWRGTIHPDSWDEWFNSYRDMLDQFAWIAQGHGVDVLVVGSELVSSESNVEQWTTTISKVRETFKGNLTYSANWDHYTSVHFWDQLDLVGLNSYYKLGDDEKVTVPEIERRWGDIQKALLGFATKTGKPLLFTEVGWCSLSNAASEPWDYTQESLPVDNDLQKRLYEAYFNVWYGCPQLGGFMMWEWPPEEDNGDQSRGYTPHGKPAEAVLREWLAKPGWKVK
jgi:hypothetical protein